MLNNKIKKPLKDALNNVKFLLEETENLTLKDLKKNKKEIKVLLYELIILGEALNRVKKIDIKNSKFNSIIQLGNEIKHNYWKDRSELILNIIKEDFENLKKDIEEELKNLEE